MPPEFLGLPLKRKEDHLRYWSDWLCPHRRLSPLQISSSSMTNLPNRRCIRTYVDDFHSN